MTKRAATLNGKAKTTQTSDALQRVQSKLGLPSEAGLAATIYAGLEAVKGQGQIDSRTQGRSTTIGDDALYAEVFEGGKPSDLSRSQPMTQRTDDALYTEVFGSSDQDDGVRGA